MFPSNDHLTIVVLVGLILIGALQVITLLIVWRLKPPRYTTGGVLNSADIRPSNQRPDQLDRSLQRVNARLQDAEKYQEKIRRNLGGEPNSQPQAQGQRDAGRDNQHNRPGRNRDDRFRDGRNRDGRNRDDHFRDGRNRDDRNRMPGPSGPAGGMNSQLESAASLALQAKPKEVKLPEAPAPAPKAGVPASRPEPRVEPRPEPRVEPRPEPRVEPRPEPQPKAAAAPAPAPSPLEPVKPAVTQFGR